MVIEIIYGTESYSKDIKRDIVLVILWILGGIKSR